MTWLARATFGTSLRHIKLLKMGEGEGGHNNSHQVYYRSELLTSYIMPFHK